MRGITRTDRDQLAALADGRTELVSRRVARMVRGDQRAAGRLVATYDRLAARPVAELSPLRVAAMRMRSVRVVPTWVPPNNPMRSEL